MRAGFVVRRQSVADSVRRHRPPTTQTLPLAGLADRRIRPIVTTSRRRESRSVHRIPVPSSLENVAPGSRTEHPDDLVPQRLPMLVAELDAWESSGVPPRRIAPVTVSDDRAVSSPGASPSARAWLSRRVDESGTARSSEARCRDPGPDTPGAAASNAYQRRPAVDQVETGRVLEDRRPLPHSLPGGGFSLRYVERVGRGPEVVDRPARSASTNRSRCRKIPARPRRATPASRSHCRVRRGMGHARPRWRSESISSRHGTRHVRWTVRYMP